QQRQLVLDRYQRFQNLSVDERKALRKRWQSMSPQQRQRALKRSKLLRRLTPQQRQRLLKRLKQ
ncbi:MAG: hypothetical protein AB2746_14370, partial [Candidatus Thiodiazotropha taylori]